MTQENIDLQEAINTGTSPTGNEEFDKNGYLVVKNLWNPHNFYCNPPEVKGQYNYYGKIDKFNHEPLEKQVEGSTARYYYPPYKYYHSQIRRKIEKIIGKKLYNTYYYDRFYNPGQKLSNHTDRPACEISVTLHISTNISSPWPIWIKTPSGEDRSVVLNPGDGMIYKGCERPHWREELPREYKKRNWLIMEEIEGLYYHQVFFHYVLADGIRAHYAYDK